LFFVVSVFFIGGIDFVAILRMFCHEICRWRRKICQSSKRTKMDVTTSLPQIVQIMMVLQPANSR